VKRLEWPSLSQSRRSSKVARATRVRTRYMGDGSV
jgi:hypothetical protein